jgi:hypothetical protein
MGKSVIGIGLGTLVAFAACGGGGGGGAGVPLVSGSLTGQYKGQAFTPMFGVETLYMGRNMIAIGDGPLNCGSAQRPDPPAGTNAIFEIPSVDVGRYSAVFVDLIQNKGSFEGVGSNGGLVNITAVSPASVAGDISWIYTDSTTGDTYGLTGNFEVSRCP